MSEQTSRSKATIKNSIWGIIQQAIVCVLSLVSRRVMVDTIGIEGVGLNGLLVNVISVLCIAEMGVGAAIVYHMYKPIAEDNKPKICALMQFYKKVYYIIALVITIIGLCLTPFLKYIVKDVSYSNSYVILIFLLFLAQTSTSYLFTFKRNIIIANQKYYIISIFDLVFKIVSIGIGVLILYLTKELAWYMVSLIVLGFINNFGISITADRLYPFIKTNEYKLDKDEQKLIFKDVKNIFVVRICNTITTSTDNILISSLVSTIATGLYSNYTIILNTLNRLTMQFSSSISGSVGNLIAKESSKQVDKTLKDLLFAMFFIGSFCSCCLTVLIDPFITLAFGDGLLLERYVVYICVLIFYLNTVRIPIWSMLSASGLFKEDKYISVFATVANLIISFIFGKIIGIGGILLGTALTLLIQYVWKTIVFYRKKLELPMAKIMLMSLLHFAITTIECFSLSYITNLFSVGNVYIDFIVKGFIAALFPVIANSILFMKAPEFRYLINKGKETVLSKIKR